MPDKVRIALDAMGGDHGASVVVPGAAIALRHHPETEFVLFGDRAVLQPLLDRYPLVKAVARLVHTDVVVKMDDKPSQALRHGRWKSSMWLAIDAVKKGEADVAVSAGNTGALMAMAKFNLRTMAGIERPAIAALWPTLRGESVVLDVGATIGAHSQHIVDMAVMGSAMARVVFDLERPTVGLLNIGVEEVKGLEEVREAGRILRETPLPGLDYVGFVEGNDIGTGVVDVVVTEGLCRQHRAQDRRRNRAPARRRSLRDAMTRNWRAKLGYPPRAPGLPHAARQDGPAQGQRRRVPRPQRHRHQEPRRHRCRGLRRGDRSRLRHGAPRTARQDQPDARPLRRRRERGPCAGRGRSRLVTVTRSVVLGCGSYLPQRILTNQELAGMVDTSDEWIVQRTGIHERRIAAPGEVTSDMGLKAAQAALAAAGLEAGAIDLIVLATSTPDNTFPASAVSVQAGLGITHGAAFDLQAVCSGFVFALATADGLLKTGAFKRALVIGAETFSRILDWTDRGTCVLFGDGAGAVVLEAQEQAGAGARIAASSRRICAPTAATNRSSMSTAGRPRPARSGTCAWKAATCSSMRSP